MDIKPLTPPETDPGTLWYLGTVVTLGALAALAALLGDSTKTITPRVMAAYLISGGVAGGAVVMLLSDSLGFSYFSLGVSILAGFKAVDLLSLGSTLLAVAIKKLFGSSHAAPPPPPDVDPPTVTKRRNNLPK